MIWLLYYWFENYLKSSQLLIYLVWICALIWWMLSAKLVLLIYPYFATVNWDIYSAFFWPIIEEIVKFIIIFVIISILRKATKSSLRWLATWILVWLWFWLYENYLYISQWLDNIFILIYRVIFVWWILLHPLTSWIAWYMIYVSYKVYEYYPDLFVKEKSSFNWIFSIFNLIWYIYTKSKSLLTILDFIKSIFVLDVTVNYLLTKKDASDSWYWHWPIEIVYEWLLLAIWLHVIYNLILTYIWNNSIVVWIVWFFVMLILFNLFKRLYSTYIAILAILLYLIGVYMANNGWSLLVIILLYILVSLWIISILLKNKFQKT